MIHIQYTLTEKEFLDYNFYSGWQLPGKRKSRLISYIVSPILYLVIVGFLLYDFDKGGFDNFAVIIGLSGLAALILFTRLRMRARFDKQALETIKSSPTDSILAETQLTISETGISGKTKLTEVKYVWDAFQEKVIANDCYYLFINARHALVIPIRAFKTRSEKDSFDKMLAQYLPLQADLPKISN